jgi:hypothetical protein
MPCGPAWPLLSRNLLDPEVDNCSPTVRTASSKLVMSAICVLWGASWYPFYNRIYGLALYWNYYSFSKVYAQHLPPIDWGY